MRGKGNLIFLIVLQINRTQIEILYDCILYLYMSHDHNYVNMIMIYKYFMYFFQFNTTQLQEKNIQLIMDNR